MTDEELAVIRRALEEGSAGPWLGELVAEVDRLRALVEALTRQVDNLLREEIAAARAEIAALNAENMRLITGWEDLNGT